MKSLRMLNILEKEIKLPLKNVMILVERLDYPEFQVLMSAI